VHPGRLRAQFDCILHFPLQSEAQLLPHSRDVLGLVVQDSQEICFIYTKAPRIKGIPPTKLINFNLEVSDASSLYFIP
jgi:hypothetical protein